MNCIIDAWQKHESEIRGYLNKRLQDPSLAEDLLQDTFVKALAKGSGFCQLDNERAWLFKVARNALIDYKRHQRISVSKDDENDELIAEEKIEIAGVDTLSACLPRTLSELNREDRDIITACDINGMNQAEYAKTHGISLSGAKSRIQRARIKLREHLKIACQVRFDEAGNVSSFTPRK